MSNNIYFTSLVETVTWGTELATALASSGERGHIYVVEPSGPFEDDPNDVWTIEHVLPQGANLPSAWIEMLGGTGAAA